MPSLYLVLLVSSIWLLPVQPACSKTTLPEEAPFDIPPGLVDKKPKPPGAAVPEPLTIFGAVTAATFGVFFRLRKPR